MRIREDANFNSNQGCGLEIAGLAGLRGKIRTARKCHQSSRTPVYLQLWHVGRMSHLAFHNGELLVAPSAVPFEGSIWMVDRATGVGGMYACPTPRALSVATSNSMMRSPASIR